MKKRYENSQKEVIIGDCKWKFRSFAYLAKRGKLLYINLLIEDLNSTHDNFKHDFINSRCIVTDDGVGIEHSYLNNETLVKLDDSLVDMKSSIAREIYQMYYNK